MTLHLHMYIHTYIATVESVVPSGETESVPVRVSAWEKELQ